MSTDEKYLLSFQGLKPNRPYNWTTFLDFTSQFHPVTPEHIFLLLYKRKYIYCKGHEIAIEKLQMDMSLGISPPFNHLYFQLTRLGIETIQSLTGQELLDKNQQTKLDI